MKFLNDYQKFFQTINEQATTGVPEWFQKGYFSASKKGKLGAKLVMNPKDIPTTWNFVKTLQQLSKKEFANVKELQQYLWSQKDLKECEPLKEGGEKRTIEQALNDFRREKGIPTITPEKFMDGLYGAQTNMFLNTLICILDKLNKIDLQPMEIKIAKLGAIPDAAPIELKPVPVKDINQMAEEIINNSLVAEEGGTIDKLKRGNRIKFKDKGTKKLTKEELDILDKYFAQDGFVRIKSKEKGYGMKYVWVKSDKTEKPNVEPLQTKQPKLNPTPDTEPSA